VKPDETEIAPRIGSDWHGIFADAKQFAGAGRVWVVQVHTDEGPLDEQDLMLLAMDQIGERDGQNMHIEKGAGAWLYECGSQR